MIRTRDFSSEMCGGFIVLLIVLLAAYGWVANIVKFVSADIITTLEIVRIIGIFLAPLGAIFLPVRNNIYEHYFELNPEELPEDRR